MKQILCAFLLAMTGTFGSSPVVQACSQDIDQVLERANKLLEESKAIYEAAKAESSVQKFVEAEFKLEEARAKFLAVQEFAQGEKLRAAQDQLRIVGQLAKLIHDGKVAIGERPRTEPAPKGPAPPALPQRLPIPDPAKIRDTEKKVRDVFKSDYAKKQAADRQVLGKRLLKDGLAVTDDPVAQWVLLHEAQDVASQIPDSDTALEAVRALGTKFECDVLGMKAGVLGASAKAAKTPEELARVAEQYLKLSEEAATADKYDLADKAVQAATPLAKRSGYTAVIARSASRPKEVTDAKARYEKIRKAYDTLSRDLSDPGANLEIGLHLCFTKMEWDAGLVFLTKGSDASLSAAAGKELLRPSDAARQLELADAWWDLAEREKSPPRKEQMLLHARTLYEGALGGLSGLSRVRVEKRLSELPRSGAASGIDLLALIDPKQDGILGQWALSGRTLVCTQTLKRSRVQIPYQPPDEYDLTFVAERTEGNEAMTFGLVQGTCRFAMSIDAWYSTMSGFSLLDGKYLDANETTFRGALLTNKQPSTIVASIRKDGVLITVDGKRVVDWKGDFARLSNFPEMMTPQPRALYVGCDSPFIISKIAVTPLSGEGKRLR